ncbi:MAG: hypothetical protein QNJ72_24320 [Pleurocapsa sp. MO_226.B13]|nr:hypothetical protein [Pleurocapsa sp. MO_226.B13]
MTRLTRREQVMLCEVLSPTWMNAIEKITKRLPVDKKLNPDEEEALALLDEKWKIEMVWAAYFHNLSVNIHSKPFNTPAFQALKTSGKSYAKQFDLTGEVWNRLPQHRFNSPMNWWVQQMLDCKKSDYQCALEETSNPVRKKEVIYSNRLQVRILRGIEGTPKDKCELIDGFSEAIPSMGLLLRKASSLAKNPNCKKGKRFITQYWTPYLDSVREDIEYSDRGGHAKKIQLVQKLEDRVYVTAPRRPVLLLR